MDLILDVCDDYFFSPYVYPASWPEDNIYRQYLSLLLITYLSGVLIYFFFGCIGYQFLFDKRLRTHPLFLPNQEWLEIKHTLQSVPFIALMTAVVFVFEVRGPNKFYDRYSDTSLGIWSLPLTVLTFLAFTDCLIYWIHRGLHHRYFYKWLHKPHHHWKVTTPFASHAFHPIDGFLQSIPYHIYPFLFPLHRWTYLVMFVFVNVWSTSIHDGNYQVPKVIRAIVNGSAHHTDHHLFYNYNYGQYFTLWDRLGGSFREPSVFEGKSLIDEALNNRPSGVPRTSMIAASQNGGKEHVKAQ